MAESDPISKRNAVRQESSVQAMSPQVKTDVVTNPAGFGEAFANAALQPTALGQIGAMVAQSASNALSLKRGQELGQNPIGDLYPPITNADKVFADAYNAQASATLSMQAKQLMFKGQEEIDKAIKISPSMIQEYKNQMSEGLSDLLKLAPTASKTHLQQQFGFEILNSTHQYNEKLISQQKTEQQQNAVAGYTTSNTSIYDQMMAGEPELAKSTYENALNAIQANVNSGVFSPSQAATAKSALNTTYYGSKVGSMLLSAKKSGGLPQALDALNEGKGTEGLTQTERDAANSYGYKMLRTAETYSNENQQATTAYALGQISTNTMTSQRMGELQQTLSPMNYIKVQTKWIASQQKTQSGQMVASALASDLSNINLMSTATDKQKNDAGMLAINNLIQSEKNMGRDLSFDDAQVLVGKEAAAPIPIIKNKINLGLLSRDPNEVFRSSQMLDALNEDGNAFYKMDDSTLARAEIIKLGMQASQTPEEANKLGDSLLRLTPDDKKNINDQVSAFSNDKWDTPANSITWAVEATGTPRSILRDPQAFTNQAKYDFTKWMMATKGNVTASLALMKKEHNRSWSESTINGKRETMLYPPEMISNLGSQSTFIWQDQIHNQVQDAFTSGKDMFDSGGSDSYFRVAERESVEKYTERSEKGDVPWSIFPDKFLAGSPVKVVKYYRGGQTKQMSLIAIPDMNAQVVAREKVNAVDMTYTLRAVDDETGISEAIPYFRGESGQYTSAKFRPDIDAATMAFNRLNRQITGHLNSLDYVKQFDENQKLSNQSLPDSLFNYRKSLLKGKNTNE